RAPFRWGMGDNRSRRGSAGEPRGLALRPLDVGVDDIAVRARRPVMGRSAAPQQGHDAFDEAVGAARVMASEGLETTPELPLEARDALQLGVALDDRLGLSETLPGALRHARPERAVRHLSPIDRSL